MNRTHFAKSFCISEADADQLSEHYQRTLSPVRIEPLNPSGSISSDDRHFCLGEWSAWHGCCRSGMNVSIIGDMPNSIVLYLPVTGDMTVRSGKMALHSQPGAALVADLTRVDTISISEDRYHFAVTFEKSRLTRSLATLTGRCVQSPIEFSPEIDLTVLRGQRLSELVSSVWRNLELSEIHKTSSFYLTELMSALSFLLLETAQHNHTLHLTADPSPALPRQVKKAIDFMHANFTSKVSIEDLSEASGCSARSLQTAFQQFKGTTPLNYLKHLRLEGVRRDLLDETNAASVNDTARK